MRNKCEHDICCHPLHKEHIGCEACHFWQQPILMNDIKTKQEKKMKRLRILKLRFIRWLGLKLTSDERSEIAFWITRNVKEPTSETLRKVTGEN